MKSLETKDEKEKFQDCLAEWNKQEDTEEKLITPVSVPKHYKKYTIKERKIVWQKPNQEQPIVGISFEEPKDAKRVDLAYPVRRLSLCI